MRRSRLMRGWAVALVVVVGGCAQTGAAGGGSDESGEYLCQGTPVPAPVLPDGATADQLGDEGWQHGDCALRYDLGGPLGERIVLDVAVYPVRELAAAAEVS